MITRIMSIAVMTTVIPSPLNGWHMAVITGNSLGRLLKQRREDLKGSPSQVAQEDVAAALGFAQSYISRLERGSLDETVKKWRAERIWKLLKSYRYSDEEVSEIAEQYGLEIPGTYLKFDPIERFQVHPSYEYFPVYHAAHAGADGGGDDHPVDGELAAIPKQHLRRCGVEVPAVMVVIANGDCMVSESVQASARSIAPGDYVAFNTAAVRPRNGDIVVCYDRRGDQLIIKFYEDEPDKPYITLYPAKTNGIPIIRQKDDLELVLRGVVFWRGGNI